MDPMPPAALSVLPRICPEPSVTVMRVIWRAGEDGAPDCWAPCWTFDMPEVDWTTGNPQSKQRLSLVPVAAK